MSFDHQQLFSTYSIVARDAATGQLGVAVQTHQMCVGRVVPWLRPGIGAVATQATTNVTFGPLALAMLGEGLPAPQVIEALVAGDPGAHSRQVAVVDAQGRVGAWTGDNCIREAGHHIGLGYSVQANMMTNDTVIAAMAEAYEETQADLAGRMLAALQAAQAEGGDIRGMQSAALMVVDAEAAGPVGRRPVYDLRVDEHETPLAELSRLVRLRGADLLDDFGHRALKAGDYGRALELWRQARLRAPELEELPFWQAVTLADEEGDPAGGAEILRPVLANDARREQWIDLIGRLVRCGIIKHPAAAEALIGELG